MHPDQSAGLLQPEQITADGGRAHPLKFSELLGGHRSGQVQELDDLLLALGNDHEDDPMQKTLTAQATSAQNEGK